MMTLPKNLSGQLIDFANEAAAALDSRIKAMSRMPNEVFPPFELPTLERFATQFGGTATELQNIGPNALNHFANLRSHMIVSGGLAGVWSFEQASAFATEFLGWHK